MLNPPDRPSPAALALERLVDSYHRAHDAYLHRSQELRVWKGGTSVMAIAAPALVGLAYFFDRERVLELGPPLLTLAVVPIARMAWLSHRRRRLRAELAAVKSELDEIGMFVACDASNRFRPRLRVKDVRPFGDGITTFEPFGPIDFAVYDREFRV